MSATGKLKFAAAGRLRIYGNYSELRRVVESIGAEFEEDITSKTNYVISNEPRGSDNSKVVRARRLRRRIITEKEFQDEFVLKKNDGEASPAPKMGVAASGGAPGSSESGRTSGPGVVRKYKCRMCGTEANATDQPCGCCGGTDFDILEFDARCRSCGAGYYSNDAGSTCPSCGRPLFEPPPVPAPPPRPPRTTGTSAPRRPPAPGPAPRPPAPRPPAPRPAPRPPAPRPAAPSPPSTDGHTLTVDTRSSAGSSSGVPKGVKVVFGIVLTLLVIAGLWWLISHYWLPILIIGVILFFILKD